MNDFFHYTADPAWYQLLKENAVRMRKFPTEAESVLWNVLKGGNLGYHFRRQHIIQDYIVDFICIKKRLTIELDGKYHDTPEQIEYDKYRTKTLHKLGYQELRFTNEEIFHNLDIVIKTINQACNQR